MGNDTDPEELFAALQQLKLPSSVKLVAFGCGLSVSSNERIEYVDTPSFIAMDEPPLAALRKKRDASLCVALRALNAETLDALVSAGNTGALVSAAKMTVGCFPGVLRPALLAWLPTRREPVAVLDVGANVQVKAAHLVQFALLGEAECRARGIERPVVGLLNIGSEAMKGTSELQTAYRALQAHSSASFKFLGNVEGKSAFDGDVHVLITDGFTGNVFLKTTEGVAGFILDLFGKQLNTLEQRLHHRPGALLIGLKRLVLKCHGYASPQAIGNAVLAAAEMARNGFTQTFKNELDKNKIFAGTRKRISL